MRNETLRNVAGIILFYMLIVGGVLAINARIGAISESTSTIAIGR